MVQAAIDPPLPNALDEGYMPQTEKSLHSALHERHVSLEQPTISPIDFFSLQKRQLIRQRREVSELHTCIVQVTSLFDCRCVEASTIFAPLEGFPARILVEGQPGMGKSTLCQWLALTWADQTPCGGVCPEHCIHAHDLVFLLHSSDFKLPSGDQQGPSVVDFLSERLAHPK
jgi:hypothetical protein